MWCMHKSEIKQLSFFKGSVLSAIPLTQICIVDPRVREELQPEGVFSSRLYSLCVMAKMLGLIRLEGFIRGS